MAAEILLTNENFVKSVTNISDNIAGKYLLSSIREAQEINLKGILGQDLLNKLKDLVSGNLLRGSFNADFSRDFAILVGLNEPYRELIERCQYFLAYQSIAELTYKVSYKIANIGVAKTNDENTQVVTLDEIEKMRVLYQGKADSCAYELQNYLIENRIIYPELTESVCTRIHSNIYSHASCGIFLGGARGKRRY